MQLLYEEALRAVDAVDVATGLEADALAARTLVETDLGNWEERSKIDLALVAVANKLVHLDGLVVVQEKLEQCFARRLLPMFL